MSEKPVVGFVGVGLMGWGMAKNAVEKGYPLRVIAHRKREAVDDLVARGAREVASLAEMAAEAEVIVLCVTGSPEVEATIAALLPAAKPGLTILDSSTSDPEVTERLAAELAGKGITLIDAPLSRSPAQAWTGELTTYVAGAPELVEKWRPLLSTWASAVIATGGPVGLGACAEAHQQPGRARLCGGLGGVLRHGAQGRGGAGGVPRDRDELGDELPATSRTSPSIRSRATRAGTSSPSPTPSRT